MNRLGYRVALVAGSLALLVVGMVSLSAPDTTDQLPVAASGAPTSNYLAFETATGGSARVALYENVAADQSMWGAPTKSVALALNNRCIVTNLAGDQTPGVVDGSVADLLDIKVMQGATPTDVQLISNGLGSPGSGKCSRSGGRVTQGQRMVLGIGTYLQQAGLGFKDARLNIEAKFSAGLDYSVGGGPFLAGPTLMRSGDNGPDSGDGDNNAVTIAGPFSSIALRPSVGSGEIALENGGDFTGPGAVGRTYFELVQLVNCGDTVEEVAGSGSGSIGSATFQRFDNKMPGVCTPITLDITFDAGVTIGGGTHDVITIVPGDDPNGVVARATLVWKVARFESDGTTPRSQGDINAELEREIQYGTETPSVITYCEGFTAGVPDHGDETQASNLTEYQPWCLLSDTRVLVDGAGGDYILQTLVMDVNGDPKMF